MSMYRSCPKLEYERYESMTNLSLNNTVVVYDQSIKQASFRFDLFYSGTIFFSLFLNANEEESHSRITKRLGRISIKI